MEKVRPGHKTALFEPVDGAEGTGEEDALDAGKGDQALGEGGTAVVCFDARGREVRGEGRGEQGVRACSVSVGHPVFVFHKRLGK